MGRVSATGHLRGAYVLRRAEQSSNRTLAFNLHINNCAPLECHSLTLHMHIQHQQHLLDMGPGVGWEVPSQCRAGHTCLRHASLPALLSLGGGPCPLCAAGAASVRTPGGGLRCGSRRGALRSRRGLGQDAGRQVALW